MQARTIATVAALAFSSIAVASESVSPSGVPSPLRAAVEKIAHLQELCAGQPDHPDCAAEGWRSACDELGEAPVRAATPGRRRSGLAQRAEISTERALLLHVSEMIRSGACFEPEPSEESLEAERATDPVSEEPILEEFLRVVRQSPRGLQAAAVKFDARLQRESGVMRSRVADVGDTVSFLEHAGQASDATFRDIDGEPLDAEEILDGLCDAIASGGQTLVDEFGRFEAAFEGVPGAEYELQRLAATVFERLESILTVIRGREECAGALVQTQGWWVAGRKVAFDSEPARPEARNSKIGPQSAGNDEVSLPDLANAVEALERECGEECSDEARSVACTKLDPLVEKVASHFEATRRLSDRSRYHFAGERTAQAEMLRHLFLAGDLQRRLCDRDVETHAWRNDYLRYQAAAVRMIDPKLGATLARYFASRFDVDLRRGP